MFSGVVGLSGRLSVERLGSVHFAATLGDDGQAIQGMGLSDPVVEIVSQSSTPLVAGFGIPGLT
jgi:hypothetical protein